MPHSNLSINIAPDENLPTRRLSYNSNPLCAVEITDSDAVAKAIDVASWDVFQQISFQDWVSWAAGHDSDLIRTFIWYHDVLASLLRARLRRYPGTHEAREHLSEVSTIHPRSKLY